MWNRWILTDKILPAAEDPGGVSAQPRGGLRGLLLEGIMTFRRMESQESAPHPLTVSAEDAPRSLCCCFHAAVEYSVR